VQQRLHDAGGRAHGHARRVGAAAEQVAREGVGRARVPPQHVGEGAVVLRPAERAQHGAERPAAGEAARGGRRPRRSTGPSPRGRLGRAHARGAGETLTPSVRFRTSTLPMPRKLNVPFWNR
jgi:hypothetical protein